MAEFQCGLVNDSARATHRRFVKKFSTDSANFYKNMEDTDDSLAFVTLSMFIIDEFSFLNEQGHPTGRSFPPQES